MPTQVAAEPEDEVLAIEASWSRAVAQNDVKGMADHMAEDWVMAGAEGALITRARFLAVVASGDLMHDHLELVPDIVRIYGDTAIVSGEARSGGTFKGQRFATHERATDIFIRQGGRWRCVFTQLTAFPAAGR